MFREKQNEKFAREQAAKDLNVLYGVVDKSVMTYHQGEFTCFYLGMIGTFAIHALHCPIGRDLAETTESRPICITDLFQNKSVAYF